MLAFVRSLVIGILSRDDDDVNEYGTQKFHSRFLNKFSDDFYSFSLCNMAFKVQKEKGKLIIKKRFCYRGAVTWNSLSAEAKQATTLNSCYSAIVT